MKQEKAGREEADEGATVFAAGSAVPATIEKPEGNISFRLTNYPDVKILQIERDKKEYEVKLSNRWEIKFDSKMRVIDIDD